MRLWTIEISYRDHDGKYIEQEHEVIAQDGDSFEAVNALKNLVKCDVRDEFTVKSVERSFEISAISNELIQKLSGGSGRDVEG